jgi:hypothetical protein
MTRARVGTIAAILMLAALPACQRKAAAPEASPGPQPLVKADDRGPIKLTVTADRDKLTIADQLTLTVAVEADPGFEVDMPDLAPQLGALRIRDFRTPPVETTANGKQIHKQVYKADFLVSGQYTIPAVTAHYRDHRKDDKASPSPNADTNAIAEAPRGELTTEPFTLEVTSLHEGEFDPAKFRDVRPAATLKADWSRKWIALGAMALGGVAVVAIIALVLRRRMRRGERLIVIPPHEWAFQQLAALAAEKLIEEGRIKEFYYRLSEIARTYIELRFGLMAPERTTEEFLDEMRNSNALPEQYQPALRGFLESCDMVKYALYEPTTDEIERSFNSARDFVSETQPTAPAVAEPPLAEATA